MPNLEISQFTNLATSAQSPTYLLLLADPSTTNYKMTLDAIFSNVGANTTTGQVVSTTVATTAAVSNPGLLVTRGDGKRSVQAWISNAAAPGPQLLLSSEIITAQGDNVAAIVFNKTNQGGGAAPATASLGSLNFQSNGNTSAALSILAVGSAVIGNNVTFYSTRKNTLSNVGVWGIDDWGTFRVSRNLGPFYADVQLSDPTKLFMLGDADNLNDSLNTALHIRGTANTMKNLVLQTRATQSVNVFEHRSSANALLLQISPSGLFSPGTAAAVDLATALLPFKDLYLAGSSGTPASNNFRVTGTATGARVITLPDASITLSGSASALTSGRIPYATTGGLLTDSARLLFDGARLIVDSLSAAVTPAGGFQVASNDTSSGIAQFRTTSASGGFIYVADASNNGFLLGTGATVDALATGGEGVIRVNNSKSLIFSMTGTPGFTLIGGASGKALFRSGSITAPATDAQVNIVPSATTRVGLLVQGAASQSANLTEWQNSVGTVLASVSATGGITVSQIVNVNANVSLSSTGTGGNRINFSTAGGTGLFELDSGGNMVFRHSAGSLYFDVGSAGTTYFRDSAFATFLTLTASSGNITPKDGANLVLGTTTGTKIGTATSQKLGFWNATPIIQPASANQAAITDSTGGTASFTLVDVGAVFSQGNINDNFATLNRQVNAIRDALVNSGIIKGAA